MEIADKGGTDSNSYATTIEADDFFDTQYGSEEWATLDDDTKARLLITATGMIDEIPLRYGKLDSGQALNFPVANTSSVSDDGFNEAKKACLAQAMYLFENQDAIKEAMQGSIQGIRSEMLSRTKKVVAGFNPLKKWSPNTLKLLSRYSQFDVFARRG